MSTANLIVQKSIELLTLLLTKQEPVEAKESIRELIANTSELKRTNEELLQQTMHYQDIGEAYRHQVLDMQIQLEEKEKELADQVLLVNQATDATKDWCEKFQRLEYRAKEITTKLERLEARLLEVRLRYKLNKHAQEWANFFFEEGETKPVTQQLVAASPVTLVGSENLLPYDGNG